MEFIVTGTCAYGPQTESSDLDIVLHVEDAYKLEDYLNEHKISTYNPENLWKYANGGYYFNLGSIRFNIIITEDEQEFKLWRKRTEGMKKWAPIKNKDRRVEVFKSITE
jgi:hypothetical protein